MSIDKEAFLLCKLESLEQTLASSKKSIHDLKDKNRQLENLIHEINIENIDCLFSGHGKYKNDSQISSSIEHYKRQLEEFLLKRNKISTDYESLAEAKNKKLFDKKATLADLDEEISILLQLKELEKDQQMRLEKSENVLKDVKRNNLTKLHLLKETLKQEKSYRVSDQASKLSEMTKTTSKNVRDHLEKELTSVQQDNENLKTELQMLMNKVESLQEQKQRLRDMKVQLSAGLTDDAMPKN